MYLHFLGEAPAELFLFPLLAATTPEVIQFSISCRRLHKLLYEDVDKTSAQVLAALTRSQNLHAHHHPTKSSGGGRAEDLDDSEHGKPREEEQELRTAQLSSSMLRSGSMTEGGAVGRAAAPGPQDGHSSTAGLRPSFSPISVSIAHTPGAGRALQTVVQNFRASSDPSRPTHGQGRGGEGGTGLLGVVYVHGIGIPLRMCGIYCEALREARLCGPLRFPSGREMLAVLEAHRRIGLGLGNNKLGFFADNNGWNSKNNGATQGTSSSEQQLCEKEPMKKKRSMSIPIPSLVGSVVPVAQPIGTLRLLAETLLAVSFPFELDDDFVSLGSSERPVLVSRWQRVDVPLSPAACGLLSLGGASCTPSLTLALQLQVEAAPLDTAGYRAEIRCCAAMPNTTQSGDQHSNPGTIPSSQLLADSFVYLHAVSGTPGLPFELEMAAGAFDAYGQTSQRVEEVGAAGAVGLGQTTSGAVWHFPRKECSCCSTFEDPEKEQEPENQTEGQQSGSDPQPESGAVELLDEWGEYSLSMDMCSPQKKSKRDVDAKRNQRPRHGPGIAELNGRHFWTKSRAPMVLIRVWSCRPASAPTRRRGFHPQQLCVL